MIDPMETVIQALKAVTPALADGNIATRHHFIGAGGSGPGLWPLTEDGLVVVLDGGPAELYLPVYDLRLEVRCYSSSQALAFTLLRTFQTVARTLTRVAVPVTGSQIALLYYMVPDSGPSLLYDAELSKDFSLQFYRARIHEQGVE